MAAAWAMTACPDSEMLVATQCENHLYPLMNRLVRRFTTTPDFAASLVEIRSTPSWHLRFSNGFVLWGRIAGPRGVNFQGLHVDWQIVDEAQEMTEQSWSELYQALNGGGNRWVYGVPDGRRTTFYRLTQDVEAEQHNWSSALNPEFDDVKDAELVRLYGGKDSPGYIHRVLGQHGAPEYGVFDLDDYLACVDPSVDFESVTVSEKDEFEAPCNVPPGAYYLGCDLGYAKDPSEFVVYRAEGPHLVDVFRAHLHGVHYDRQQEIIQALDQAYDFRGIGVDAGNSGEAVAHNLMALGDRWFEKIATYRFGSRLQAGTLPDGQPDRRETKRFMTELIERRLADRTIVFPPLPERESQYAGHTYTVGEHGRIRYSKGDDHIIDADRCAVLRHFEDTHLPEDRPPLGAWVEVF